MIFIRIFPVFTAFFTLSFTIMFNPGIGQTIPVANFTTSDTGCTGSRTVDFQDLTSGSPDQWFWNFGDNNTDTVQNPSHTYSVDDTFTVTLVACNMMGCDTVVKNIILKGPLAATCFPNATYYCCLQGIYNVTVGAINNTTSHDSGKYKNYSCNFVTTLTAGQFFSIEIETGPSLYENVRAWIDFNDDALFDTVNEKVFESLNKLKYHSGLLYLPDTGNVKTGRTLRMRVGSDNVNWPVPEPCTNPRYGQFEDYGIIIKGKSIPPTANFTGSQTVICLYSTITFTDLSGGFPDSWYWDFGDTTTSTLKNPSHTYTDTGIFTVSLVSFNQYGSDTMLKTGYIRVLDAPIPSCIPPIINSCCGTGIYRLLFATIDNITGDSADWYSDFTCEQYADVLTGGKYSISVETGPVYSEDLRAWIDYNNDGIFSNQGELVLSSNTLQYHNGIVRIPAVSDTNISLRMRIASDYGSVSHSQACDSLYYGQAEDYSVRCYDSHLKPEADFTYSIDDPCARVVEFYDFSSWLPVSWFWDFGDGSTGSGETVIHDYLYAGNYSVQLIAVNSYGSDTTVINFFIDSVYASFNVPNTVFAGQNTAFYNYSSGANSYSWNFGDGKTSSSVNPTHIYNNTGTVTVTLIAANTLTGCSDTIIKQIIVLPPGYISELPGKSNTVRIDPNPVTGSGEIVIYDDKIRDWQLIFSDIYGKDVIRAEMLNTNKFTFNSQELSAGLYFYKVIHKDALIGIGKIIIE